MIETSKIVSGKYDSLAAQMLPSPHSYVTRGHDLRLEKIGQDMIYVNSFLLTEWPIFGIRYRIMLCMVNC